MCRRSRQLYVVLYQHSIVQYGEPRGAQQFPLCIEARTVKHDVVGLPYGRRSAGVYERWILPVHGRRLTVGVGAIVVGIEDLHFVPAHQIHPAVATLLSFAARRYGRHPFDVQLAIAESLPGVNVAAPRGDLGVSALDLPVSRLTRIVHPPRAIPAIEQDLG